MAVSVWERLSRDKILTCFLVLHLFSCFKGVSQITRRKTIVLIKEREILAGYSPLIVISKVLASRMRKLITTRARKNKRNTRMLANASKDHSIPLLLRFGCRDVPARVLFLFKIFPVILSRKGCQGSHRC